MISNQAYLFLIFSLDGIIIGLIFDTFRILRRSFKTNNIITYIEDVLFWIITGLIMLYTIFVFNNGELRLFMFLGIFLGASLYILTISQYVIKISVGLISIIKKVIFFIIKSIAFLFKIIFHFIKKILSKPILFITVNFKKISQNFTKKIKKSINNVKISKKKVKD